MNAIASMHEVYLMILCGFCGVFLLFLYRSTREKGILYLSLAVLCWFFSGLATFSALTLYQENWTKVGTSVFSTLNSIFLLLMLSHLDPGDLPPRVQLIIARESRQFVSWVGIFIAILYIVFLEEEFWQGFYFADLVFSSITLALLFFSFYYIFKKRVSLLVALVSWVALLVTLLAHFFRAFPQNARRLLGADEEQFAVWSETLKFAYKPLLIVTFFALIVSWLWQRVKTAATSREIEKAGLQKAHENNLLLLKSQWDRERQELLTRHTDLPSPSRVLQNRQKFPKLDETDWTIVERIAKGDKVPAITKFLGVKDGFVPPRIEKIANALNSASGAQIDILRLALLSGVLTIDDLDEGS